MRSMERITTNEHHGHSADCASILAAPIPLSHWLSPLAMQQREACNVSRQRITNQAAVIHTRQCIVMCGLVRTNLSVHLKLDIITRYCRPLVFRYAYRCGTSYDSHKLIYLVKTGGPEHCEKTDRE